MQTKWTQPQAYELLKQYNQDAFHLRHGRTVEEVMRCFARELGYGEEEDFWGIVGLLHDLDFEQYPEEHCIKSQQLMQQAGLEPEIIHATASHAYGQCCDIQPEHLMEKVWGLESEAEIDVVWTYIGFLRKKLLFATDELTGLIWAAALMRPSKSTKDMELKSLKKKFKDKRFAAGCSRETIQQGAQMLGWELDQLLEETLKAMQQSEDVLNAEFGA